jgi:protein involved in polysaccharide export with SLBB domain
MLHHVIARARCASAAKHGARLVPRLAAVVPMLALLTALRPACEAQAQPVAGRDELRLRAGDVLRVAIRDEPALSGEFAVGPDGVVMLPLVGPAHVAGRPVSEVLATLRASYARELAEPDFTLLPLVRVAVTGEVRAPGLVLAEPTFAVADVLALAGGPTPAARRGRATLVRDGVERRLSLAPASPDLALALRSGDVLHVERRGWLGENLPVFVGAAASVAAAAVTTLIVR